MACYSNEIDVLQQSSRYYYAGNSTYAGFRPSAPPGAFFRNGRGASFIVEIIFCSVFLFVLGLIVGALASPIILGNLAAFIVLDVVFLILTVVTFIYRRFRY